MALAKLLQLRKPADLACARAGALSLVQLGEGVGPGLGLGDAVLEALLEHAVLFNRVFVRASPCHDARHVQPGLESHNTFVFGRGFVSS